MDKYSILRQAFIGQAALDKIVTLLEKSDGRITP